MRPQSEYFSGDASQIGSCSTSGRRIFGDRRQRRIFDGEFIRSSSFFSATHPAALQTRIENQLSLPAPAPQQRHSYMHTFCAGTGKNHQQARSNSPSQPTTEVRTRRLQRMKRIIPVLFLAAASFASAQIVTPTTDVLGAHLNYGRGCPACHAPHSGAYGNGIQKGFDSTAGSIALWGEDVGSLYGKVII